MKKILAILLALALLFVLCACGETSGKKTNGSSNTTTTVEDDEDEKEPLVLQDETEYYVCAIQTKHVVIEKASDLSNYKIGYIISNSSTHDSEAIAKYYEGDKGIAGYNGENDSFSGLSQDIDVNIVTKQAAEEYVQKHSDKLEIVFKGPYTK